MAIEKSFEDLCQQVFTQGLKAALVTDKDGVVILKCTSSDAPATVADPSIPTTFAVANNQASKLGLGQNQCIVSVYSLYQVVQFDHHPLIITLVADATANTGLFMNFGHQVKGLIQPLVDALQDK